MIKILNYYQGTNANYVEYALPSGNIKLLRRVNFEDRYPGLLEEYLKRKR